MMEPGGTHRALSDSTPITGNRTPAILVVDDDPRNRDLMEAMLEDRYTVLLAASGAEAVSLVTDNPVDLVLLDVMMPGRSGFDVVRDLKEHAGEHGDGFLPIILVTAMADKQSRYTGLEAGADDFLTKPVDRRELRLRVATLLRVRTQEQQIRAQLAALTEVSALKDDLISLIVHDIRNPLFGVVAFLELAQGAVTDPEVSRDLYQAQQAAERVRVLLEDLLRVRALEDGKVRLCPEAAPAWPLLSDAVTSLKGIAQDRALTIDIVATPGATLWCDREMTRRALENLLVNAMRYAPKGSTVELEAIIGRAGGSVIEVRDRGPGIPQGVRGSLFRKFGSLERHVCGARRGFGLGLYLVRLVADAHGGAVTVEDRSGGGTVFTIVLPNPEPGT